jgi:Protein of unknown function (DUF3808)
MLATRDEVAAEIDVGVKSCFRLSSRVVSWQAIFMPFLGRSSPGSRSSVSSSIPAELAKSHPLLGSDASSPRSSQSQASSALPSVISPKDANDSSDNSDHVFVDAPEVLKVRVALEPLASASDDVAEAGAHDQDVLTRTEPLPRGEDLDDDLHRDISAVTRALDLFLDSRIAEAEKICLQASDSRLYYAIGYSLILAIKSLMTFEPSDFDSAIGACRVTLRLATQRRPASSNIYQSAARWARGAPSVSALRAMSVESRHAELIHAEAALLNALLAILHSGDFLVIAREALSVRAAFGTYNALSRLLESDEEIRSDADLRSGVHLGNGLLTLLISLLPAKFARVIQLFGYGGDRATALRILRRGGMWEGDEGTPSDHAGIRRALCDAILLFYHLVLSAYIPVDDVDLALTERILKYDLVLTPHSAFYTLSSLFFTRVLNVTTP